MDPEQQDILLGFVEEGREMIDEVEPLLIELEQSAEDSGNLDLEKVNTVFRLFHSLKGGAGFLDLNTVSGVTHEAETLLDMFRKGSAELRSDHIDLMNRACDFIRLLLDQIETEFHDRGYDEDAEALATELQNAIAELKGEEPAAKAEAAPSPESDSAQQAEGEASEAAGEEEPEAAGEESSEEAGPEEDELPDLQLEIGPEMIKQFTSEADEALEKAEQALLSLEKNPNDQDQIQLAFREIHSFKGNAGFLGFGDMQKLSHGAESVLDKFREGELEPSEKVINLILEIIDFLRNATTSLDEGKSADIPATPGLLHLLEDYSGATIEQPSPAKAGAAGGESAPEKEPPEEEAEGEAEEEAEAAQPAPEAEKASREKAPEEEAPKPAQSRKEPASRQPEPAASAAAAKKPAAAQQRQSVRVDVEKLDVLLDLVGELVISEAMVAQNPDIKGLDVSLDRFEKAVMQLDKITRDLQDIATSIRMIPLSGTFRRMVRLVRDLSQKANKKVDFQIEGEDTEVDKTVIEQITDPLVHIIRNGIDHGLETPEERQAAGKPPTGTLLLEAKYVGGEVWIVIEDDGRGLSREKILKKAVDRGLVDGDPDDVPDEKVWQLIFHPGFSTADKITDVSGRGVGMDVVKRNIENIRGKVDVTSKPGHGTQVVLRIPLTLAIIDGMLVRVGNDRFTLPITAIRESMQVDDGKLTKTMDGQEIIKIREDLIPIVRLHELLDIPTKVTELREGIITIVENEGDQVCLFVDELLGQQQIVIKGMSEYMGDHPCVSGCTILGDGDISLILDVAGIINEARNGSGPSGGKPAGESSRKSESQGEQQEVERS